MKATDHAVLAAIRKRADRDRLGYNGKAFVSKDPKVEIVEDRQWLLEYIEQFDLDAISLAIGTNEFLDPPDGGGPSLADQVRRMKEQLDLLRIRAYVNVCACCKNTFVQPLVCTTCGSQRLYDMTLHTIAAERTRAQYLLMEMMKAYERRVRSDCKSQEEIDKRPWECTEYQIAADFLMRTWPEESLSEGNLGEPKACTPAEERGIVGATGAGQLPATTAETRDSAERRSPGGHSASPSLDESNQHLTALRTALADAAGIITLATDLKPISEWQHDLVRRAEAWISSYYKNCINQGIVTMSEQMAGTVNQSNAVWLIESVDSEPTIYFCGVGDWCSNPHHAYKFAVREAAEANRLSMVNPSNFKVTEHLF